MLDICCVLVEGAHLNLCRLSWKTLSSQTLVVPNSLRAFLDQKTYRQSADRGGSKDLLHLLAMCRWSISPKPVGKVPTPMAHSTLSVATALAGVFAILVNKICKIMEIFQEQCV